MIELPLFPLNIVVFPGEALNLHIFEPRYKQLIRDCLDNQMTFGIPSFVNNKIELGTEVKMVEVTKEYPDERMDIKTQGLKVFEVKSFKNPWRNKLYAGGKIKFQEDIMDVSFDKLFEFREMIRELFSWLGEKPIEADEVNSVFDIGHKIGLRPEEEYELLAIRKEDLRINYAIKHLGNLIPALERAQTAQDKIRQNGHFKHLDPLKF